MSTPETLLHRLRELQRGLPADAAALVAEALEEINRLERALAEQDEEQNSLRPGLPCAHEWRSTGEALLSNPPLYPEVCSLCGARRNVRHLIPSERDERRVSPGMREAAGRIVQSILGRQPDPVSASVDAHLATVRAELLSAVRRYPPMHDAHHGWAILREEVDELWEEVKKSPLRRDLPAMRTEAVQVAAMAVRFLLDVTGGER